ncbi:LacI family transcriptional regulator [Hypnocyclicus thermotrophus]|uniref:LacI family transcriptional regulator n=1 Tax=Hypnocyclicus thermotrophus TaxID=1627895 RepID=A0AA46DXG8_9FUSO|nr:LacI family DNA-binding transcriptional regulator [Hypnocyclicus thermotrophus]TDT67942.1 LacI family transcriptional regulator [Hypnocyclicus thermotrophus]
MNSKKIAKLAGVSRSTVSRVINNYSNVTEETRKKVQAIIDKYGYTPDAAGRSLAGKKNKVIGLFIVDHYLKKDRYVIHDSPYLSEFISYATDIADDQDYHILVSVVTQREKYEKIRTLINSKMISGAIFVGGGAKKDELEKIINLGHKIVLIDEPLEKKYENVLHLLSENFEGGYMATEELIKNGHKKIAHITGELEKFDALERLRGYKKALEDNNIKLKNKYIAYGDFTMESGYLAIEELYEQNKNDMPTAIFVANDFMAIKVIEFLENKGFRIPEDISIIGFDNSNFTHFLAGGLTTISRSIEQLVNQSITNLINFLEKDEKKFAIDKKVKVKLIKRNTVKSITD